jgi:hypothetical protein
MSGKIQIAIPLLTSVGDYGTVRKQWANDLKFVGY